MSTQNFIYNEHIAEIPDAAEMRIGIVVCEWNNHITDRLLQGALETLQEHGVKEQNITIRRVPGSFELVYGSAQMAKHGFVDGIIAIGCVIKGDTPHFDYICMGATQGLVMLNANGSLPVINGVLTVNTQEQADERAGIGENSVNKGKEFALTAIKMIDYAWQFQK